MRAGLILGTTPPRYIKGGVGQVVGHLHFASRPDDTTLAYKRDRKLDGWFFSAAPFLRNNPVDFLVFGLIINKGGYNWGYNLLGLARPIMSVKEIFFIVLARQIDNL